MQNIKTLFLISIFLLSTAKANAKAFCKVPNSKCTINYFDDTKAIIACGKEVFSREIKEISKCNETDYIQAQSSYDVYLFCNQHTNYDESNFDQLSLVIDKTIKEPVCINNLFSYKLKETYVRLCETCGNLNIYTKIDKFGKLLYECDKHGNPLSKEKRHARYEN